LTSSAQPDVECGVPKLRDAALFGAQLASRAPLLTVPQLRHLDLQRTG